MPPHCRYERGQPPLRTQDSSEPSLARVLLGRNRTYFVQESLSSRSGLTGCVRTLRWGSIHTVRRHRSVSAGKGGGDAPPLAATVCVNSNQRYLVGFLASPRTFRASAPPPPPSRRKATPWRTPDASGTSMCSDSRALRRLSLKTSYELGGGLKRSHQEERRCRVPVPRRTTSRRDRVFPKTRFHRTR